MKKIIIILLLLSIIGVSFQLNKNISYNGIDISHHNIINWNSIKKESSIKFCYIKSTEGKNFKDKKCIEYSNKAKEIGLYVGLYHYFRTGVSAEDQFRNFESVANKIHQDLIPVIDVEEEGNDFSNIKLVNSNLSKLIQLYYDKYNKYPIIYLGGIDNTFKTIPVIRNCKFWLRTLEYSNLTNFSIEQIDSRKLGPNYIDLNYCKDLEEIKL